MAGGDTSTGADHSARIIKAVKDVLGTPVTTNHPYTTAYGGKKRGILTQWQGKDYLLIGVWQGVGGTVDEKFPYLLASAQGNDKFDCVVIILGGGGARKAAVQWAKDSAAQWEKVRSGRLPKVVVIESAEDFRGACQRAAAHGTDLF
jgi:hypothetical protein